MATFGHTTPGATLSAAVGADRKHAFTHFMPEDGRITDVTCDIQNDGADIQVMRVALYAIISGSISRLIAVSDDRAIAPGTTRRQENFALQTAYDASAGQAIYASMHFGTIGGNVKYWLDGDPNAQRQIATDIFADGPSDPWGTTTATATLDSVYLTYTPVTSQVGGIDRFYSNAAARVYAGAQ